MIPPFRETQGRMHPRMAVFGLSGRPSERDAGTYEDRYP